LRVAPAAHHEVRPAPPSLGAAGERSRADRARELLREPPPQPRLAPPQFALARAPAVALLRAPRPGRAAEPRHVARHGAFDRSAVVRLDVDGTEGRTLSTRSEPRLQRVEVRNERQFLGREPPPLVQSPRRSVPRQHLEPDYLGTAFAQTRDSVADERRRDAFPTRARP